MSEATGLLSEVLENRFNFVAPDWASDLGLSRDGERAPTVGVTQNGHILTTPLAGRAMYFRIVKSLVQGPNQLFLWMLCDQLCDSFWVPTANSIFCVTQPP